MEERGKKKERARKRVSVGDAAISLIIFAELGCWARPYADTFRIRLPTLEMGQTSFVTYGQAGTYDVWLSLTPNRTSGDIKKKKNPDD